MAAFEKVSNSMSLYRAVRVEFFFPRVKRLQFLKITMVLALLAFMLFMIAVLKQLPASAPFFSSFEIQYPFAANLFSDFKPFLGLIIFFLSVLWGLFLLDFYFLATSRTIPYLKTGSGKEEKIYYLNFGGARRLFYLQSFFGTSFELSKLYGFFKKSNFTRVLFARLAVPWESFIEFAERQTESMKFNEEEFLSALIEEADSIHSNSIGAKEVLLLLFRHDEFFEQFLFSYKVHKKELMGASEWTTALLEGSRQRGRWWEKSVLGRIQGIGKDFGFGFTYTLDSYSSDILSKGTLRKPVHYFTHQSEVLAIEEILSRSAKANVLLIGEPGKGKHTILKELAGMIGEGRVMPALEYKRMARLDTVSVTAQTKTKGNFEGLMIKIMNDAVDAGNIILVIDNFPEFLESSAALGVNLGSFLEPYLKSSSLQIIALANTASFYSNTELNQKLASFFEKVEVRDVAQQEMMLILEDVATQYGSIYGILITYGAIAAAYELSDRYITEGTMPQKAVDLLDRATVSVKAAGKKTLLADDVKEVLQSETRIPLMRPTSDESEKLLKLEEELHSYVINQNEAVRAIADAIRRVRSGLHAWKRPIGSFLFLGPTGVGKTQTAKALAKVYFGSEDNMMRFDMSEFQSGDGIEKFIGSFETKEQGVLSIALQKQRFGLLLFDEFEKSSASVVNIFLQILEEGFFTNALGRRISAKETVIIATSNAGSNLIWELVQRGIDPSTLQEEVINEIRKEGVFSPEILNRFDAIVVFHPLKKEQLKEVAKLLLNELKEQLLKEDIIFIVNDDVVEKIAEIGYDPVMGARPMRRAISSRIEQVIARKLLSGEIQRGSKVTFTKKEIEEL